MLCDLLLPQDSIRSLGEWKSVHHHLLHCHCNEITAYELYLALGQTVCPVPTYIIGKILERNTNLVKDNDTFQTYCTLAYQSEHTPFVTIKYLLDASNGRSAYLANALLRKSLGADFGRFDIARELIRYEPSVLLNKDHIGNMLIHECCVYCESPAMTQLLVDEALEIIGLWLPRNNDGMTAIDVALECEYTEVARGILSILIHTSPSFPSLAQVVEYKLLHVAARISDVNYARQILQEYPEYIHCVDHEGSSPLHIACLHGDPIMIVFLLNEEIRLGVRSFVNTENKNNQFTPLQLACINPRTNLELIKTLIKSNPGSDSLATMVWKYRLLHITAMGSNSKIAQYFIELFPQALAITSDTGSLPIRLACISGSADMVELLFTKGRQFDKNTGLLMHKEENYIDISIQLACSNRRMSARVLKLMLQEVAMSTEDVLRGNLLNRAITATNFDIAKLVLSYWPSTLYLMDEDYNLPLHLACKSGSTPLIRYIFRKSLHKLFLDLEHYTWATMSSVIYQKNLLGETPWDLLCTTFSSLLEICGDGAFTGGTWPCIKFILNLKAMLLRQRPSGSLPLYHVALMTIQHMDMVGAVIIGGLTQSDACIIDVNGRTALHVIAQQHPFEKATRRSIIEYLLLMENGTASASIKDNDGNLPLHVAVEHGLDWSEGVDCIFKANFSANNEMDKKSGLYPFMLAASCTDNHATGSNLESIYNLLRFNPSLLNYSSTKPSRQSRI